MNELHYGWPKLSIPEPKQTLNNPTQSKFFCSKFSTFTLRWFTLLLSKDEPSKIRDMRLKKVSPNSKLTNVILVDVCMNCFCNWQLSWLENNSLTISLKLLIRKLKYLLFVQKFATLFKRNWCIDYGGKIFYVLWKKCFLCIKNCFFFFYNWF